MILEVEIQMKRKWLAVGIILLFIGTGIIPSTAQDIEKSSPPSSRGVWLYVGGSGPGNYTKIQDAVDNASSGDTVFVYDDSSPYYETVYISKSINLIGENTNTTTIIDTDWFDPVLTIVKSNVLVTGFTIKGETGYGSFKPGIYIKSNNNSIYGNNISSGRGITLDWCSNNSIFKNIISGYSYDGIGGDGWYLKVENNTIFSTGSGCSIFMYVISHVFFNNNLLVQTSTYPCIRVDGSDGQSVISNNTLQNGVLWYNFGPLNDIVSNNTVNGKPLVFLYNVSDRLIDYDAGQVIISRCDNITIENQNFSNLEYHLQMHDSMNCKIIDNIISNAKRYRSIEISNSDNIVVMNNKIISTQIEFSDCNNISISKNTITKSLEGINFGFCNNITISYNNLIDNFRDITFRYECRNCSVCCNNFVSHKLINKLFNIHINIFDPVSSNNTVKRNYWERPRLFPKPIYVRIYEGDPYYPDNTTHCFYFDWHPKLIPYNISGMR